MSDAGRDFLRGLARERLVRLDRATTVIERIHRHLYPEQWMTAAEIEAEIESGHLNADGLYEWRGADDLEAIAGILMAAVDRDIITPTQNGDNS